MRRKSKMPEKIEFIKHYSIRVHRAVCGRHVHYRQSIGHQLYTGMWIKVVNCPECMKTQEYETMLRKVTCRRLMK
jgi:hypothetical protein